MRRSLAVPRVGRPDGRVLGYLGVAVLVGALAGWIWRTTTVLPGYTVQADGHAVISEIGLTRLFEAEARYSLIGMVGGLVLGVLAVLLLRHRGWRIVLWAVLAPVLAGLVAWGVGVVGATPLHDRLAGASVGRTVPVDLALHTPVAVLLWPFLAMLPVLLYSTFSAEDEGSVAGPDHGDPGPGQADQVGGGDLELQ